MIPPRRTLTFIQKAKIALSMIVHRRTPLSAKALLIGGLLYGIMPLDLIPDLLPVIGALDDATVLIVVVLAFLHLTKTLRSEAERDAMYS